MLRSRSVNGQEDVAVSRRLQTCCAAVLGLCLLRGGTSAVGETASEGSKPPVAPTPSATEPGKLGLTPGDALPTRVPSNNQKMADAIAGQLRQSAQLKDYRIDVSFHDKTVVLYGSVTDQMQKDEVLRIVQGVPGVDRVIDRLQKTEGIARVQAEAPRTGPALPALPTLPPPQQEPATAPGQQVPSPASPTLPPLLPPSKGLEPGAIAGPPEPTPIFSAPPPNLAELGQPRMPPYAWPTYAPYNNFSRVAYPTSYPYNAWPYIGPYYPFPKIPPGWRSVKLEWDDGHWWFSKHATKYDWWRLRYW